ncbi:MAG TPA: DUF4383 domain-containing protein [Pseudonocardiaceae bacterium]|jgi:hypothetical protein|nr:DUF4383 domain-containing protein [Pseudonocardiaceae bacterium]
MQASEPDSARRAGIKEGAGRTLAQVSCLVGGAVLIAVGVLGFFFGGSDFTTGADLQGQNFIVFEVNGWHNVVHIATGAFLVLMAATAGAAVAGLLIFGVAYLAVTVLGFIDGNDVVNLIPVNPADNWLHVALTIAALLIAVVSGGLLASGRRAG